MVKSGAYLQAQADLRQSKMKPSSRSDVAADKKDRKDERRKKANEGKIGGGTQVYSPWNLFHVFNCSQPI